MRLIRRCDASPQSVTDTCIGISTYGLDVPPGAVRLASSSVTAHSPGPFVGAVLEHEKQYDERLHAPDEESQTASSAVHGSVVDATRGADWLPQAGDLNDQLRYRASASTAGMTASTRIEMLRQSPTDGLRLLSSQTH